MRNERRIYMSYVHWHKWIPIQGIPNETMYVDELTDGIGEERLRIKLSNDAESYFIEITFDAPALYMYSDEGKRLRTLTKLEEEYGRDFYTKWTLVQVENSEILSWVYNESCLGEAKDVIVFKHYVIAGMDEFIDVISQYEPEVTMHRKE